MREKVRTSENVVVVLKTYNDNNKKAKNVLKIVRKILEIFKWRHTHDI